MKNTEDEIKAECRDFWTGPVTAAARERFAEIAYQMLQQLLAKNERYRAVLESISEYWNGNTASAVDAAEEMGNRANEALKEES